MDTRRISYFLQLATNEHMSATADLLNISQPSLSKAINQLENDLGVKLFDRVGNRIRLNHNGELYAQYARKAMELLEAGRLSVSQMACETNGSVFIGCYAYTGILTDCINEYLKINPFMSFTIRDLSHLATTDAIGTPDFLLSSSDTAEQNTAQAPWIRQTLFTEGNVLLYSPSLILSNTITEPVTLQSFKDVPFITMSKNSVLWNDITYSLCISAGFFPKNKCCTDDFIVKVKMIAAGHGVAFMPQCCVADALQLEPDLQQLPIAGGERSVSLLRQRSGIATEAAVDFWNFALDYYGIADPDNN